MTPTSQKKTSPSPPLLIRPPSRRLKSDSSSPTGVLQRSLHAYQEEGKWWGRERSNLVNLRPPTTTQPPPPTPSHQATEITPNPSPQFPPGAPRAFPESDPACLKNMAMEGRRGRKPFSRSTFGKRGGGDCPFRKAHISRTPFSSFQPPEKSCRQSSSGVKAKSAVTSSPIDK